MILGLLKCGEKLNFSREVKSLMIFDFVKMGLKMLVWYTFALNYNLIIQKYKIKQIKNYNETKKGWKAIE